MRRDDAYGGSVEKRARLLTPIGFDDLAGFTLWMTRAEESPAFKFVSSSE